MACSFLHASVGSYIWVSLCVCVCVYHGFVGLVYTAESPQFHSASCVSVSCLSVICSEKCDDEWDGKMVWEQEVYKKNTGLFKWNINLVALHYIPQI